MQGGRLAGWCAALLLAALLAGCAGPAPQGTAPRPAAGTPPTAPAQAALEARLHAIRAGRAAQEGRPAAGPAPDGGRLPALAAGPAPHPSPTPPRWRRAEANLYLDARPPRGPAVAHFPAAQATATTVRLHNVARQPLQVSGRCDGPTGLRDALGPRPGVAAGAAFALTLGPTAHDGSALRLGPEVTRCTLQIRAQNHAAGHSLLLEREPPTTLDARTEVCPIPPGGGADALERAFRADRWLSRSCLMPTGRSELLTDGMAAFNAKVAALMGRPLPEAALEAGDPEMPLDFGAAPTLELILLSYLQLRADFSGRLLTRMLAHHAARGTTVRILVSHNLQTGKDRALLARLAADYPAVQLQAFRWQPPRGITPASLPDRLQRGHHAKAFGTLGPDPASARFMVGGRNLHDGFLFDRPRALAGHPRLHDYDNPLRAPLAYFAAYEDLELSLHGPAAVTAMMAHMATLWHRDAPSAAIRPFSLAQEAADAPRHGALHFLSVPQADGRALEAWLVDLFDATARQIDIVTPYVNLTPPLAAALDRALARGVRVRLLLPAMVEGDLLGGLKIALKQQFLRRFGDRLEAWQLAQPERLLHSKFLIFDGRLALVTSANLNARSLLHDTENGIAVWDPSLLGELEAVFAGYLARARPIGGATPPHPLRRWLLDRPRLRSWF